MPDGQRNKTSGGKHMGMSCLHIKGKKRKYFALGCAAKINRSYGAEVTVTAH